MEQLARRERALCASAAAAVLDWEAAQAVLRSLVSTLCMLHQRLRLLADHQLLVSLQGGPELAEQCRRRQLEALVGLQHALADQLRALTAVVRRLGLLAAEGSVVLGSLGGKPGVSHLCASLGALGELWLAARDELVLKARAA